MARNLKLELTNYSRNLYGLRGVAYPGSGGDNDDDDGDGGGGGVMRRIRRRLLAINQGRGDTIDYLQSRHIGIQHTYFFFVDFTFLFPLANIGIQFETKGCT